MMDFEPQIGDLVWAKMKGFSPWPARVVKPGPNSKRQTKKGSVWIYFFGSNDYAWIELHNIKPYFKFKEQFANVSKSQTFKDALHDIEDYITKKKENSNYHEIFDSLREAESEEVKTTQESPAQVLPPSAKRQK